MMQALPSLMTCEDLVQRLCRSTMPHSHLASNMQCLLPHSNGDSSMKTRAGTRWSPPAPYSRASRYSGSNDISRSRNGARPGSVHRRPPVRAGVRLRGGRRSRAGHPTASSHEPRRERRRRRNDSPRSAAARPVRGVQESVRSCFHHTPSPRALHPCSPGAQSRARMPTR